MVCAVFRTDVLVHDSTDRHSDRPLSPFPSAEDPFIASKPGEPDIPLDIKGGRMLAPIPGLYQYIVRHSSQQLPGLDVLNALHKAEI